MFLQTSLIMRGKYQLVLLAFLTIALSLFNDKRAIATAIVIPTVETPEVLDEIVSPSGDADDPAIWLHPTNPALSLVVGTVKDAGLRVYDLEGSLIQTISPDNIRYNNVDLLYNFNIGGQSVDLAIASDRRNDTLAIFKIDPTTRLLENITSPNIGTIFTPVGETSNGTTTAYGLATYRSPLSNRDYVFVSQREAGTIAQLELFDDSSGGVTASLVRTLTLPIPPGGELEDAQIEGMVADVELGYLYAGQENRGIWKFSAEPQGGETATLIDAVKPEGTHLEADVEGLTIYYGSDGTGYLLASSQGDNTFAIYQRQGNNQYLDSFTIGASATIDSVEESDGAAVLNVPLGEQFPFGLFVTQDGSNAPEVPFFDEEDQEFVNVSSNFKYVAWDAIANTFSPDSLLIEPSGFDPRQPNRQLISAIPESSISGWGWLVLLGLGFVSRCSLKVKIIRPNRF
ncbi:phytase [Aphanothece hegewaldii]|nr:phytase [Aphanothece hegewaldii]